MGFPHGSDGKESAWNAGDLSSTPGSGSSPGEGNGNPLQDSCLEESHGQRSLVGHSPWHCKESDTSEQLTQTYTIFATTLRGMYTTAPFSRWGKLCTEMLRKWPKVTQQGRHRSGIWILVLTYQTRNDIKTANSIWLKTDKCRICLGLEDI